MARLYGKLFYDHHNRQATRTARRSLITRAETCRAMVSVHLDHGGKCTIFLSNKNGNNRRILWAGNADREALRERA